MYYHIQTKQLTRDVAGFFTEASNGAYYFSATNPMDLPKRKRRRRCSSFSQDQQQSHGEFPQTIKKKLLKVRVQSSKTQRWWCIYTGNRKT